MQGDSAGDAGPECGAAADAELGVDAAEVSADGDRAGAESATDCFFRKSLREQHGDLQLTRR